jgi:hypothetical protein
MGPPLRRGRDQYFYESATIVYTAVSAHLRCNSVQVIGDSVDPLSLQYTKQYLYKIYVDFQSMKACATRYALTYVTTVKLQLYS